jgi:hypothetical protein
MLILFAVFGDNIGDSLEPSVQLLSADPVHAPATLLLSVLSWLAHFGGIVGLGVLLVLGAGIPLWYGFFLIVEKRLIPGPIDDWIAAGYEPYRKYVNKNQVLRVLKWSGIVCLIVGGCLLGSNTHLSPYGFILLATSSGQWLVASIIEKNKEQITLYAMMFVMVDCFGVYRWLVAN